MKRVYLNTIEEVIKALKEGKVVKSKFGNKYKFLEGLIVCNNKFINTSIDCSDSNTLYIEEEEPLKIEVGKFYKNKAGNIVRCFKVEQIYCHFTIDNYGTYITDKNGKSMQYPNDEFLDIIGPWED